MKSIIIYGSHHHGSTEALVTAIAQAHGVDLWNSEGEAACDLCAYDLICFASGIDFGRFYPAVTKLADALPEGKRVYALFTCAKDNGKYGDEIREIAAKRACIYLGKFGCKGYNTYGPWKLIGGMNKNHPSAAEISSAIAFYEGILRQIGCPPFIPEAKTRGASFPW